MRVKGQSWVDEVHAERLEDQQPRLLRVAVQCSLALPAVSGRSDRSAQDLQRPSSIKALARALSGLKEGLEVFTPWWEETWRNPSLSTSDQRAVYSGH